MLKIFKSSKAAIDLASIMVGVVVIGLIGGVIAATVFAVIPWAQDTAARKQVDEVSNAQNAFAGLSIAQVSGVGAISLASGVKPAAIVPGDEHPFGNLSDLVNKGLLTVPLKSGSNIMNAAENMCTVAVNNGADYRTEVKSETGALFLATNQQNKPQPLSPQDSFCFGNPSAKEVVTIENCTNQCTFYTRLASGQLSVVLQNLQITSDKTTPMDWEIRINKNTYPLNLIQNPDVNAPLYLTDSRIASKIDGNYIVIYNKEASAQIKQGTSFTVSEASYRYAAPAYTADKTKNGGPVNLNKAGSTVWADLNVELVNTNEQTFGTWATDFDITNMKTLMGQNGTLTLNSGWAEQGFSLSQKSGNIYTLTYTATSGYSFALKGKAVTAENFNQGAANLSSALKFTGDGQTTATVTAAGSPSGDQYYATQVFNITAAQGAWGPVEVNVKALRDFNRSKNVVVNDSNFTLTPKQGDTTGNIYLMSFKGTWQSPNSVTVALQ